MFSLRELVFYPFDPTIFLLFLTIKCLIPLIPNESKYNSSLFREIFKILHRWVPLSLLLSVFEIINGYFLPDIIFSNIMNLFILSEIHRGSFC